jgi:Ca2+-binding RTX toxin-like protein
MRLALLALGLTLIFPSIAQALPSSVKSPVIRFERDAEGNKPNGFTSADSSITHFSDSIGSNLDLYDANVESDGFAISSHPDDGSKLIISFDVPIKKLSLLFGNDHPSVIEPGDVGRLDVFKGGVLVDSAEVVANDNDAGDQTVAVKGVTFKRAEFYYARGDTPLNLIEVVDNIRFSPACMIKGTNAGDRLDGSAKSNSICGFEGNDRINARGKNDFAHGGGGKDRVKGGPGGDTLLGGSGSDVIRAQDGVDGNDTVYGGGGNDTC